MSSSFYAHIVYGYKVTEQDIFIVTHNHTSRCSSCPQYSSKGLSFCAHCGHEFKKTTNREFQPGVKSYFKKHNPTYSDAMIYDVHDQGPIYRVNSFARSEDGTVWDYAVGIRCCDVDSNSGINLHPRGIELREIHKNLSKIDKIMDAMGLIVPNPSIFVVMV